MDRTLLRPWTRAALAHVLWLVLAAPAIAQTQADLFDETLLHDLQLAVNERDWETLRTEADQDTYYPADLRWGAITARNVGIRSRGAGTRNGIKPGLRIDFNRYLNDQTFLGLKALVLDNSYTDPSTMREVLSMKLFARMGMPAPRETHVRLFVNGAYAGLYVLIEPIDRTFVDRVFGAREAEAEDGGYLYEFQWVREYGFEYLGTALEPYAELFEPKTHETDAASRLYQPLEALARAINDTPLERLEQDAGTLIDLAQVVRFVALQHLVAEIDGFVGNWGMSNFYLYRFGDGRPAQLVPWDADHAFWVADMSVDERLETNVLTRRLMAIPSLRALYLETLAAGAAAMAEPGPAGEPWLDAEADRLARKVAAAVAADPVSPFTFEDYAGNVANLRALLQTRPAYVACAAAVAAGASTQACTAPSPAGAGPLTARDAPSAWRPNPAPASGSSRPVAR
jgi:hypothetical protein